MDSQKDFEISILRVISLILIISCHIMQYYGNELAWWFNIGVQLFFCISGFLYGQKEIGDELTWVFKNIKKIVEKYYLYLVIILPFFYVFAKASLSLKQIVRLFFCTGTIEGLGHLWFIRYILICYILTPFLNYLWNKIQWCKNVVLKMLQIIILMYFFCNILNIPQYYYVVCYIFAFCLGKIKKVRAENSYKYLLMIIFPIGLLMNGMQIYNDYIIEGTYVTELFKAYAHTLLGMSLFVGYLLLHNKFSICEELKRVLIISDKYSFDWYMVHQVYILGPFGFMSLHENILITIVLIIVLTLSSGLVLNLMQEKLNEQVKGKYKI